MPGEAKHEFVASRWRPAGTAMEKILVAPVPSDVPEGIPGGAVFYIVMHLRHHAFVSAALAALLMSCTNTPVPSKPDNAASSPAVAAVGSGPEHTLQKGMTAEAVKRIMGEPAEIKPMQTTTGHAEVWVYHRASNDAIRQVQVGTKSTDITTIGGDGQAHVAQTIEEPVFAQQIEIVEETISLLMFDGTLIEQKTTSQKRLEYK